MSYPGSKTAAGVPHRIIGQMPPHKVYVEPFAGSGMIALLKARCEITFLSDLDKFTVAKLSVMFRDRPDVRIEERDAFDVLDLSYDNPDKLIYLDPPYMLSTRKGRRYYRHEFTDSDHRRMLGLVKKINGPVIISHPATVLYVNALSGWRCIRYQAMTRGGLKPDALWMNFPEPTELHDWRFAGRTFRESWNLKRVVRRWARKIQAMPARKRGYLFHELGIAPRATPQTALSDRQRPSAPETALEDPKQ